MRWVLRKDLVGDTSAHEAGPLRIVGSSLKVALASGFTWGAGALAAAFMACWGMGAWIVLAARAEYVASFLSATSAAEINAALERARARERAAEEDAGAVYRGLIETYEGHLQSLRVLEREKERFVATGEHLVGTLEAFP